MVSLDRLKLSRKPVQYSTVHYSTIVKKNYLDLTNIQRVQQEMEVRVEADKQSLALPGVVVRHVLSQSDEDPLQLLPEVRQNYQTFSQRS